MNEVAPLLLNCDSHGRGTAAVICHHMLKPDGPPVGVIENSSDPDDLKAWCLACKEKFKEEGGVTKAFRDSTGLP